MKIKNKIALSGLAVLVSAVFLALAPIAEVQAQVITEPIPLPPGPANPSEIGIKVTVQEAISLSVNTLAVDLGTLAPSSIADVTASTADNALIATVTTNSDAGWELTLIDGDTETGLTKALETHKFLAHTGDVLYPSVFTAGDSVWGYRVSTWASDTFAGVPASDETAAVISEDYNPAFSGAVTNLGFGAQLAQGELPTAGDYTDVIVLTAVVKSYPPTNPIGTG